MQNVMIQFAIQTLLGLIAVALNNPTSTTFKNFRKPLRIIRDSLNQLPLDDLPPPKKQPGEV